MSATKDALIALRGGAAHPRAHAAAESRTVTEVEMRSFLTSYVDNHNLPEGGAAIGISLRALKSEFGTFDASLAAQLVRKLTTRAAPAPCGSCNGTGDGYNLMAMCMDCTGSGLKTIPARYAA